MLPVVSAGEENEWTLNWKENTRYSGTWASQHTSQNYFLCDTALLDSEYDVVYARF
jgi:hypothetical protein